MTWFDRAFQRKATDNNLKSYPSISPASLCALINHSGELKLIKGKTNREHGDASGRRRATTGCSSLALHRLISPPLFSTLLHIVSIGGGWEGNGWKERQWEREERGRIHLKKKKKEEADLWEDYGICVTIQPEGNAADTFAKRDSFSAGTSRLQRAKMKANKRERMWRGDGRRLHGDSVVVSTSAIAESTNGPIKNGTCC